MPSRAFRFTALAGASLVLALPASPAMAETLREALLEAYRTNPTLLAARANQRATDEGVPIARASGLPSLSASAQHTEFLRQAAASFIAPERSLSANVDLGIPIYSGGSVRNAVKAADTRVGAGQAELRGIESSVFAQVVAAYMDVILNEAITELSANNVEVLSVNFQATSDRFEIGDLTRTDVAQSEARLALARSELRSSQANLISARERYIQLVGSVPGVLEAPPPLTGLPDSAELAVAIALENNPDLLAARERAKAAELDIEVAGAGRLPRLEVFTTAGYTNFLGSLGSIPGAGAAEQINTTAQAGVRATIPIFQGGRVAAQERQAQSRAAAALEQEIGAEREVIATVRSAFGSWQAANSLVASNQAAVDAAALSLEGVRAENTVGNRTILDILNAQQELLRSQVQLATARRNAYVAGFSLLAAMGMAEARDLGLDQDEVLYDPDSNYRRVRGKVFDWAFDPDPIAQATRTVDTPAQDGEIPPRQ